MENKKNILFSSGSLRMGGLERVLIEVLQNIDKESLKIQLVINDDAGDNNVFEKDVPIEIPVHFLIDQEYFELGEKLKYNKKNFFDKMKYNSYLSESRKKSENAFLKYIKDQQEVEVIVDFDGGLSRYIEKVKGVKKILWLHNSPSKLLKKPSKIKRFGKRLEKYDMIVAICDDMKNEVIELFPHLKERVIRIYNPFNFERIQKFAEDGSFLSGEERRLIDQEYCLAVSRLDTVQKDYDTLLKAFSKFKKSSKSDLKLYICGDGPSRDEIEKMIDGLKLSQEVVLLGQQKNPYIWMKHCLFFVHSSKYEGLPTVLIEALILGKTIISSDCPTGPREILNNGDIGYLFKVGDFEKLSQLFQLCKENQVSIEQLQLYSKKFGIDIIMNEYFELLRS